MEVGLLIARIMAKTAEVIASVVEDATRGDYAGAQRRVERFEAATDAELEADVQEALDVLHDRAGR